MTTLPSLTHDRLPYLPFEAIQYATISRKDSRAIFKKEKRLHQKWGVLLTRDQNREHWTLLGDHSWVVSLRMQAKPLSEDDGIRMRGRPSALCEELGIKPLDVGIPSEIMSEWPLEEFRAQWSINKWPDEWHELDVIRVCSFPTS
jgi:hypothetical protein